MTSWRTTAIFHDLGLQAYSVQELTGGFYSLVKLVLHHEETLVCKIIGCKQQRFSYRVAHELVENLDQYHAYLQESNINLPKILDVRVLEAHHLSGQYLVAQLSQYVGENTAYIIQNAAPQETLQCLQQILSDVLIPFFMTHAMTSGDLAVGIDPKPANFTRNGHKMFYVDLMPPLIRKNGIPLSDYPAPETNFAKDRSYYRYYTITGVIHMLYLQTCRLRPNLHQQIYESLRLGLCASGLHKAWKKFQAIVPQLQCLLVTELKQRIIQTTCAYELRSLGVPILADEKELLEQVFQLTTRENETLDYNLGTVKKLLLQRLPSLA